VKQISLRDMNSSCIDIPSDPNSRRSGHTSLQTDAYRERQIQTYRHTQIEMDRQTDRQSEILTPTYNHRKMDKIIKKQPDRETCRERQTSPQSQTHNKQATPLCRHTSRYIQKDRQKECLSCSVCLSESN